MVEDKNKSKGKKVTLQRLTAKKVVKKTGSTLREVKVQDPKALEAVIIGREKIKNFELEIKKIKGDIEGFEQIIKSNIFSVMGNVWGSVKMIGKAGNLKAIWSDRFSAPEDTVLETNPELERFLEYNYNLTPEATENPTIFKEIQKFINTIEKKHGVELLSAKLQVKKNSLQTMLDEKNELAIEILRPTLVLQLESK